MKTYYMHTMDDQPAYFDGRSIWFWGNPNKQKKTRLVESLKKIRKEQERAKFWWGEEMKKPFPRQLGYIRIAV